MYSSIDLMLIFLYQIANVLEPRIVLDLLMSSRLGDMAQIALFGWVNRGQCGALTRLFAI